MQRVELQWLKKAVHPSQVSYPYCICKWISDFLWILLQVELEIYAILWKNPEPLKQVLQPFPVVEDDV